MKYEITQSLISAWQYTFECWEGQEEAAMNAFLLALRGEKEELTEEQAQNIKNGHDFENMVYLKASEKPVAVNPKWERGVDELAGIVKGAQFQVRIHRSIIVQGMEFDIHGVLDALKAGVIYDIKFKNKSFHSLELAGDYLGSAQHPFYFYLVPEARKFLYLVSDGQDIYIEQYIPSECRTAEEIISEFVDYLRAANLLEVYKENWALE